MHELTILMTTMCSLQNMLTNGQIGALNFYIFPDRGFGHQMTLESESEAVDDAEI